MLTLNVFVDKDYMQRILVLYVFIKGVKNEPSYDFKSIN